ncbi:MAG: hypothetical protein H7840_15430 [Alphaproteobacteria bacterium]
MLGTQSTDIDRDRYGWSINDWAKSTGISRASAYNLLAEGKITSVKYHSKRIVTTHPRDFLASLAGEAA